MVLRRIHSEWILMNTVPRNTHPLGLSLESLIPSVQSVGQEYHKGDECHLGPDQSEYPGDSSATNERSEGRARLWDDNE